MRRLIACVLIGGALAALTGCGSTPAPSPVRQFGVLQSVDVPGRTVVFLEAALFTGNEAVTEAAKDEINLPVPFYVRKGTTTRTLPLASDAHVTVLGYDADGNFSLVPASADAFLEGGPERDATPYYWLDISGDRIVGITAVETP